jgi:hypothetical protein
LRARERQHRTQYHPIRRNTWLGLRIRSQHLQVSQQRILLAGIECELRHRRTQRLALAPHATPNGLQHGLRAFKTALPGTGLR